MTRKSFRERIADTEKRLAIKFLSKTGGAFKAAARLAGLHPTALRRIVKRHNLQQFIRSSAQSAPRSGNEAWRSLGDA